MNPHDYKNPFDNWPKPEHDPGDENDHAIECDTPTEIELSDLIVSDLPIGAEESQHWN